MIGARAGATNWLRRLAARALARDLAAFVVPGPEIARAGGLDLAAAGLRPVANPRHAGVLVLVGDLPDGLARAAAVAYAQMPRPRAILALGVSGVGPLPAPDVVADLRQEALADAVGELRRRVATGAFGPDTAPFDAAALRTETRYTCPMHPEIIRDRPGRCPICGMNLVPQQAVGEEPGHGADATDGGDMAMGGAALTTAQGSGPGGDAGAYTCPMHPEIVRAGPGSCPICGMDLVPSEGGHEVVSRGTTPPGPGLAVGEEPGATTRTYTCPMHPEIVRAEPGECPLCGMDLVPRVAGANAALGMTRAAPEAPSYTCPMHPEIIRDRPGSCPECGMDLVPRRDTAAAPGHGTRDAAMAGYEGHGMAATAGQRDGRPPGTYTCPMHPEIIRESPGQCPLCGMALVPREGTEGADTPDAGASGRGAGTGSGTGGDVVVYTCPMHPEVGEGQPGSCPLCGMDLIPRAAVHRDGDTATPRHEAHRQHHTGAVPGETRDTRAEARGGAAGAAQVTGGHAGHTAMAAGRHAPGEHDAPGAGVRGTVSGPEVGDRAGHADAAGGSPARDAAQHDADGPGRDHRPGASHSPPGPLPSGAGVAGGGHAGSGHGDHAPAPPGDRDAGMAGMAHGPRDMGATDHGGPGMAGMGHDGHDMGAMDHGAHMQGGFMSMVAMTEDLPRSRDGLPMEWLEVPFGPLFPGLPGGLALTLTLDGDVVARASIEPGLTGRGLAATWPGPAATLPDRLAGLDPLTPVGYRLLALHALEAAADVKPDERAARARVGALERERAASHLGWLASLADLLGDRWLAGRAAALQLALLGADDPAAVAGLAPAIRRLLGGVGRTPLLRRRLAGIGRPGAGAPPPRRGPVARAAGAAVDARLDDPAYRALGFAPVVREGDDALARLGVRLAELDHSLDLIGAAGSLAADPPAQGGWAGATGHGAATLETPRGAATLHLALDGGIVRTIALDTPSTAHAGLVPAVAEGRELADALAGVASLDLSPWELDR